MWNDATILAVGLVCLVVGGLIGAAGVYGWLMRNSNGVDDEDWIV